jgi:GNAT superfamily N-acetyltransferase
MDDDFLHIRRVEHDDLPALLALYQHLNPGDERPTDDAAVDIVERFNRMEGSAIFVGEMNASLVGSCTLVVLPNLTRGGRPYGLIENVVTHSQFRKRGIGKRLLDVASRAAWQAGCYKVMLMTGRKSRKFSTSIFPLGSISQKPGFKKM